jgi:hypothetical protein
MNEELLKSLNGAIELAIQQMVEVDQLAKGDVSLQDAKLRPESANGSLPGDTREDSTLKPEDANKAEHADKGDLKIMHDDGCDDDKKAKKGENPFADKDGKKDSKKDDDDDDDDEDDMDDDKAEKMKAKIKKYEDEKAAKTANMTKSAAIDSEELKKSIVTQVADTLEKSFGERLTQLEGLINKLVQTPQPRQSVSGLAPLVKNDGDAGATSSQLSKSEALDKLLEMQKNQDKRVDSSVIARVEMNDFSVLAERNINLK